MAKNPVISVSEDETQALIHLASELSKGILELEDILEAINMSADEFRELSETRTFKNILQQAQMEWASATNTQKRVKLKAAAAVEEGLPYIFSAMIDPKEVLSSRVSALQALARIGGMGESAQAAPESNKRAAFSLSINYNRAPPPGNMVIEGVVTEIQPPAFTESLVFSQDPMEEL